MNHQLNTDALVADLKSVVRDSEQFLQEVAGATGERAEALRERLSQSVASAKETCCKLQDAARENLTKADQAVRDHPYQTAGVALAVGVVIGALIARK